MTLVTSGKLRPTDLVEHLVSLDSKQIKEKPLGSLLLLIGAPLDDDGMFVEDLERSVHSHHDSPTENTGWLSTAEFPTLGVEANEPSEADQVELLAELGSATHVIVPLRSPGGGPLQLGRAPNSSLLLNDPSVSAKHARLFIEDGGVRIEDLGSKNGTLVNSQRLDEGDGRWLQPMDRIAFGRISGFACDPRALRAVLRQDLKTMF